jgi:hypothetical protein
MLLTNHKWAYRTGTVISPATVLMIMGEGNRSWSGSSPAWIKWYRHANASPRLPVSNAQSLTELTGGGFNSVGSVNTMGKTTVHAGDGGVRVESVQR